MSTLQQLEQRLDEVRIEIATAISDQDFEEHGLLLGVENELERQIREFRLQSCPEPEPLIADDSTPTPYPLNQLPKLMREAIQAIAEHVQLPEAIAGQCVLGAATYVAQTRVNVHLPLLGERSCSLFMLSLADSGDRKSSAHRLAFRPIAAQERELVTQYTKENKEFTDGLKGKKGKALDEYLESNLPPVDPKTILSSDASFSRVVSYFIEGKSSLFWDSDEGSQMLAGHSMKADDNIATLGGLTKLWDNGMCERVRAKSNLDGSGLALNRRLSIHLMAQEVAVRQVLRDPIMREQGFLPRFIFTAPRSLKGTRFLTPESLTRKPERDPRLVAYWQRLSDLMATKESVDFETSEVNPPCLDVGNDAQALWLNFYNSIEKESGKYGDFGNVAAFASRSGELALRIAGVLAFFQKLNYVDTESMSAAIALVEHSLSEWLRYSETNEADLLTREAARTFAWLCDPQRVNDWQEFNARDLQRFGVGYVRKSASKRDEILALLCEHSYLLTSDGKRFIVNPKARHLATAATNATAQQNQGFEVATDLRQVATEEKTSELITQSVAGCRNSVANANPANTALVADVARVADSPRQQVTEL